jgi:hypothetical protein
MMPCRRAQPSSTASGTTPGSTNLPDKSNFQKLDGLDAITGKSNFDISEWMLIKLLEHLGNRIATIAMLCKTSVARKVLMHAWTNAVNLADAQMRSIDSAGFFGVSVDACLFLCSLTPATATRSCSVYTDLTDSQPARVIAYEDGQLVSDLSRYKRWKHLEGRERHDWRSGIKHDCSDVMEFFRDGDRYRNYRGESVDLEDVYLYPMLKSSELAGGRTGDPRRWMLVTQTSIGDDTSTIELRAPKTWKYLQDHSEALDRRGSSIYRNRSRFSVFGVGDYSFAPWKVAISGFYKKLQFGAVGGFCGKPIVLDDTAYFMACGGEEEAQYIASLLNSDVARDFLSAYIFWDAKRPITVDLLRRLDLFALARELGTERTLLRFRAPLKEGRPSAQQDLFKTHESASRRN